jgi:hypothetical protein
MVGEYAPGTRGMGETKKKKYTEKEKRPPRDRGAVDN